MQAPAPKPPPKRGGLVPAGLIVGLGGDALVSARREGALIWTTDTLVAGVHFLPETAWGDVGWKALAVNLRDIAAMGGAPPLAPVPLLLPGPLVARRRPPRGWARPGAPGRAAGNDAQRRPPRRRRRRQRFAWRFRRRPAPPARGHLLSDEGEPPASQRPRAPPAPHRSRPGRRPRRPPL